MSKAFKVAGFLKHEHTPQAIAARLRTGSRPSYLRDLIYGASDGVVTTFAIVAGVRGAELSEVTILILGLSNVVADGFSMSAGNYLATKAEQDKYELAKAHEELQTETNPSGEKEELRQIYRRMGVTGDLLEQLVQILSRDRSLWVRIMLFEEYGLTPQVRAPLKAALITFAAFLAFGLIPLLPFVLNLDKAFMVAAILTALAFLGLGALKSRWSVESGWAGALKTLLVGAIAAGLAYFVGVILGNLVP
jgi:VIT1/CCC1 family predicted Fe2+/Mn2+ transporter